MGYSLVHWLDNINHWFKKHPRIQLCYRLLIIGNYSVVFLNTTWVHDVKGMVINTICATIYILLLHLHFRDGGDDEDEEGDPETPWGNAIDRMIRQLQRLPV